MDYIDAKARIVRIIYWFVTLVLILLIAIPIVVKENQPHKEVTIKLYSENEAIQWLLHHENIVVNDMSKSKLCYIDQVEVIDDNWVGGIDHEMLMASMLYSQTMEETYRQAPIMSLVGVEFSGVIGSYYKDIGNRDRVPQNIINKYEFVNKKKWDYEGEGLIFDYGDNIMVLVKGEDYQGDMMLNVDDLSIPFYEHFEVTMPSFGTVPIASFSINTTESGQSKLDALGISSTFSAAYKMTSPLYSAYYFAGEFDSYETFAPSIHPWIDEIMSHKVLYEKKQSEQVFWQWFYPLLVNAMENEVFEDKIFVSKERSYNNVFLTDQDEIYIKEVDGEEKPFFIKGMNLGAALPGKYFKEFPMDEQLYHNWFEQMGGLNINTVRVYTLLPPAFYKALQRYNTEHDEPIYLLQEIWPEEDPEGHDYLRDAYNQTYQQEIQYAVDAIHGNVNIPYRTYRAYGLYRYDVSPWLLGYLVGRELEPLEVATTNKNNPNYTFTGKYIYGEANASPTEQWLAFACNFALQASEIYDHKPVVGIVSWPTLDVLSHSSEWNEEGDKSQQYNDSEVVDINNIGINEALVSGFIGAYHIYPNYPDFMNNDPEYDQYEDEQGVFRYGAYLQAFMNQHKKYPAIVAEYGISTSMATAHYSKDLLDHGGMTEYEQAKGIIRMTDAIIEEGYAGAIIFEWMDEWAKKTWTTEPYMIPYDRHALWHNVLDPEQNYGLIGYKTDSQKAIFDEDVYRPTSKNVIKEIVTQQDEAYLYIQIEFADNFDSNQAFMLELNYPTSEERYAEFVISVGKENKILVNPGYNWLEGSYFPIDCEISDYEEMIQLTNGENITKDGIFSEALYQNLSRLNVGQWDNNLVHIERDQSTFRLRLPYGLIGMADPSTGRILYDDEEKITAERDAIDTIEIDRIQYSLTILGEKYLWEQRLRLWEQPTYEAYTKSGVDRIGTYFEGLE